MNAREHFEEAEERLKASDWQWQEGSVKGAMHEAAVAQVHATLALAAAHGARLPEIDELLPPAVD